VEREAPVHISNLMAVHNNKTVRVGWKILGDKSKIRIAKKINEELKF
jgi:Ribosomal protein L24